MLQQSSNIETLFSNAGNYLETRIDLFKLKAIDKSSTVASSLTGGMLVILIAFFSLVFINIGLSLWIGDMLGKLFYGFFIVGGFYLLAGLVVYILRNTLIKTPMVNFLLKRILK